VIFFNPTKPGGKFHFRFYMMCSSSSYACVRLWMHTKNKSDVANAISDDIADATIADAAMSPPLVAQAPVVAQAGLKTTGGKAGPSHRIRY
jgi:hypothetical protein